MQVTLPKTEGQQESMTTPQDGLESQNMNSEELSAKE